MKWQPIETAPKDGTRVDLWVTYSGDERNQPAAYRETCCEWRIDKYGRGPFWCRYSEDYEDGGWTEIDDTPTHWMPPPEPPEIK